MDEAPIGIFDSGVGGLTVARAIIDQLPGEELLYVGDTLNSPYGPKPIAQVREMALEIMDQLAISGVKMLVIACNTATAAALQDARERYFKTLDIPVVEVVHPAARRAAATSRTGKIGVIATETTVASGVYKDALNAVPGVSVFQQACPRFVEFVERGQTTGEDLLSVARQYLEPVKAQGVDTLIMGCTHYPMLTGVISFVMGDKVSLVSSAEETANDVYRTLVSRQILRPARALAPRHQFRATGPSKSFDEIAKRFLTPALGGGARSWKQQGEAENKEVHA